MSKKLKDFITELRACKTTEEEKKLILDEKAAIRQSFQKNQHSLKPRNLVKLLFINLQGHDTTFGQIESLNVTCRNSFIEKKVGYLTMSVFLNEKSEMLLMATNRIALDLEHPNPYIQGLALSVFSSVSDEDMASQISNKLVKILREDEKKSLHQVMPKNGVYEDPQKQMNVQKKTLLAALRVLLKSPDMYEEYIDILDKVFKEKNHGIWISALPLYQELFKLSIVNSDHVRRVLGYFERILSKTKLLMNELDHEYVQNGINDPYLIIKLFETIRKVVMLCDEKSLNLGEKIHQRIHKLILSSLSTFQPQKKTVNAILYEIAKLALFYKDSEELTSCGFHILNQLMDIDEKSPNFKFASLNLLKNFGNYSDNTLKMLTTHCEAALAILNDEDQDDSLQILSLQVLTKIVSSNTILNTIENLKNLLLKMRSKKRMSQSQQILEKKIIQSIFEMLRNSDLPMHQRVKEQINLLLIISIKVSNNTLSTLINDISAHDSENSKILNFIFENFENNWKQNSFFELSMFFFGEWTDQIDQGMVNFNFQELMAIFFRIYSKLVDFDQILYFLNSLVKILVKSESLSDQSRLKSMNVLESFQQNQNHEVQIRSHQYYLLLSSQDVSRTELKDILAPMPHYEPEVEITPQSNLLGDLIMPMESDNQKPLKQVKKGLKIQEIFSDEEISIKLEYKHEEMQIKGSLVIENNTSSVIFSMTAMMIGIQCPGLEVETRKISKLDPQENEKWKFKISPAQNGQNFKLKYVVRFYYSESQQNEDYRQNKEGMVSIELNQEKENLVDQGGVMDDFLTLETPQVEIPQNPPNENLLDLDLI